MSLPNVVGANAILKDLDTLEFSPLSLIHPAHFITIILPDKSK